MPIGSLEAFRAVDILAFSSRITYECAGLVMAVGERFREQRRWALNTLRDFGFGRSTIEDSIREELVELCRVLHSPANSAAEDKSRGTLNAAPAIDPALPLTNSVCNVICTVVFGARLGGDPEIEHMKECIDFILRFQANRKSMFYMAKYEYCTHLMLILF